mmetsp:Transcript_20135/g.50246  ORF Transcript_20135/g.50246 Transcript_20135/m.50246 type:complete len:89 (-) Transcript_20135:450-716(-)
MLPMACTLAEEYFEINSIAESGYGKNGLKAVETDVSYVDADPGWKSATCCASRKCSRSECSMDQHLHQLMTLLLNHLLNLPAGHVEDQ